ncbi:FAD-binding domain-containing protein [Corynespora cassiicola Philippines]|uniref:FAD-binding domain-containing protein n=1 Tax=Corynespora cassiicola Philippines TaxID=1448308 RepID=A0A2T2NHW5_CORCC|nr:FAD-binding domain-containing protein [Corynespora cassiicola Philippines]
MSRRGFTLAAAIAALPLSAQGQNSATCRYLPTDVEWPSTTQWNELNSTVGGRLVATVPLASVCHDPNFDSARCSSVRSDWTLPLFHEESPSSILAPYYQNQSCDPFTPQSQPCVLGNYVSYSINASSADDIAAGISFAKTNNIRLVIKNTGHDYLGRSTGTGALSLWTHNLRNATFHPSYASPSYTGPAITFGAGTRGFEAIDFAHEHGVQVITGSCPTVGIAGGFLQGGGSGPLASTRGMAADQVLELEVVTAGGELMVASPAQNQDLYWAMSGGGGSSYGVVVAVTLRAFADGVVGGASLAFSRTNLSSEVVYEEVFGHVLDSVSALIDAGMHFTYTMTPVGFSLGPLTAPGFTVERLRAALAPFTSRLDELGIEYSLNVTSFPDYKSHFWNYWGPYPAGPFLADSMPGTRLIPRESLSVNRTALIDVTRNITENSSTVIVYIAANLTHTANKQPIAENAVLPQWRRAAVHALGTLGWDYTIPQSDMLARQAELVNEVVPQLRAVLPADAGTYLNEAEIDNKNWKQDFFGANYERLREVKSTYDPDRVFYAEYGVGSEDWIRAGDGRLCRV